MDTILRAAEATLRQSAAPALRLGELLRRVRAETHDLTLGSERLLGLLRARPDTFRILDPWRGPWRFVRDPAGSTAGYELEPWVLVIPDPADSDADGEARREPGARRMRSCVRWLAEGVDASSSTALARWSGMALAADETQRALRTAA